MCRMTDCCFYLPLREGCILASMIEFICGLLETVLYITFHSDSSEEEKAAWLVEICNIEMCCILLFFGSLKEERVCVILHCFFLGIMLVAEAIFQTFAFEFAFFYRFPDWLIAYEALSHCFLFYMIFVSCSFTAELRDKNCIDAGGGTTSDRHRPHRQMSSAMASEIYGM